MIGNLPWPVPILAQGRYRFQWALILLLFIVKAGTIKMPVMPDLYLL